MGQSGGKCASLLSLLKKSLTNANDSRGFRNFVARFLGYGKPDFRRVETGAHQRVTVIGFGRLLDGRAAEFVLPLPPSLADYNPKIRVIITLSWFSPINSRSQKYRVAHLWFNKPRFVKPEENVKIRRSDADYNAAQRGTLQHEIFECCCTAVKDESEMIIKVNCRKDASDILTPVRFGLAVTLEVKENMLFRVPIYDQVRERLSVRSQTPVEIR